MTRPHLFTSLGEGAREFNPARRLMLGFLARLPEGELTIVEGERRLTLGGGYPRATIRINSPRAWLYLLRGSRGLGEGYAEGLWDADDLTGVVRVAARNAALFDRWRRGVAPLRVPLQSVLGRRAANSRARSRRDIAAHYDLGNELFALMLDETMMYSCAYFEREDSTLAAASIAKLDLVCDKLDLGPEDHVLEIGTGWGGFAVHAARTRGCRVTTTTISRQQYQHALRRVQEAGLSDRVSVLFEDYRDLRGRYDKLVSIEMIEAVGWKNLGTFFACCSQLLQPAGAMLLEAIVIDDRAYAVEKASRSFIKTYIFPGGALPSVEVISRLVSKRTDLRLAGLQELTPHYVETLRRWRRNFEANARQLERLGYDERFRRLWRLYLAYSEAGFAENRIGVVQTVLAKPSWQVPAPVTELSKRSGGADTPGADGPLPRVKRPKPSAAARR